MNIRVTWKESSPADRIILVIYILAFAGATFNHVSDLVEFGFFPYSAMYGVPAFMNIYWTALTLLDPLAILVLLLHVRRGCLFYLAIMLSDVTINLFAEIKYWKQPLTESYGLILQVAFLLFLLFTFSRFMKKGKPA
ncbi:MAG: hypothetical protein ACOYXB_07270 [Bacteroidota bacterium]